MEKGQYNAVLTGAAFLDSQTAFPAYWADAVKPARDMGAPAAALSVLPPQQRAQLSTASWWMNIPCPSPDECPSVVPHLPHCPAVDSVFNGEDLLMNFVLANASGSAAVEFIRPTVRRPMVCMARAA